MDAPDFDISGYALLDHESLGYTFSNLHPVELFQGSVVRPSLAALDAEISRLQASDDPANRFFSSHLEDLFQASVEGYVLTTQAMWERGLRSMLLTREKKLATGIGLEKIERAVWRLANGTKGNDLHQIFEKLMGFPISAFDAYEDLDLLQSLGNAIRHGDGAAARRVHELAPGLWWNWIPPGETYMAGPFQVTTPEDGPTHPSFSAITMPQVLLEQMIQSVLWFWQDIESIRCNSFERKDVSVVRHLASLSAERALRASKRVWFPSSNVAAPEGPPGS